LVTGNYIPEYCIAANTRWAVSARINSAPWLSKKLVSFAAELLMPSKYLIKHFTDIFGGRVDGTIPDDGLAFWLSTGTNQTIDPQKLASRPVRYRSMLIAQTNCYGAKQFVSFADQFEVSPTSMAIQLEDLCLVR
jgi:hypothetical protein